MLVLRLILICSLFVGGGFLAWHVPWKATADFHGVTHEIALGTAPWFSPPSKPKLDRFKGKFSPYLDPKSLDIRVSIDDRALFARFAGLVVGAFFVFGVTGWFLDRKPVGSDVAFSLSLTTGFLASSLVCLLVARLLQRENVTAWLPYFWAGGLLLALLATVVARRRAPSAVR
jgi:hypothetical protein